jgi:hypothetical protein
MIVRTIKPTDADGTLEVVAADGSISIEPAGPRPVGTVIEHPEAWIRCEVGDCEPVDDEAKALFEDFQHRVRVRRNKRLELARQQADDRLAEAKKRAQARRDAASAKLPGGE